MLDLTLRLLQLLVCSGTHAELIKWVQQLNSLRPAASDWPMPGEQGLVLLLAVRSVQAEGCLCSCLDMTCPDDW